MTTEKGPAGKVPLTTAVKRSLAAVAVIFGLAGGVELYMLSNPETIAPISWAFWWLNENAPGLAAVLAGVGGAFYAHFFWYLRPGNFWYPMTLRAALIIAAVTLGTLAGVQAWRLLVFQTSFMFGATAAHKWWFRIEHFDEHLSQFHEDE